MPREYEQLKYLRVPKGRLYEFEDWASRVDEELEQIIRGLDMLIDSISNLSSSIQTMIQYVPQYQPTYQPVYQQQVIQNEFPSELKVTGNVIALPAKVDIYDTDIIEVDETKWYEYDNLSGDIIMITADDDVFYAKTTGDDPFPLRGNNYLIFTRYRGLNKLYFRAAIGSTKVYIQKLVIKNEM